MNFVKLVRELIAAAKELDATIPRDWTDAEASAFDDVRISARRLYEAADAAMAERQAALGSGRKEG